MHSDIHTSSPAPLQADRETDRASEPESQRTYERANERANAACYQRLQQAARSTSAAVHPTDRPICSLSFQTMAGTTSPRLVMYTHTRLMMSLAEADAADCSAEPQPARIYV